LLSQLRAKGVTEYTNSGGTIEIAQRIAGHTSPSTTRLFFVVVLHLSPAFESHLEVVLQKWTAMPVIRVSEPIKVEANHLYVIPPRKHLLMADGHLTLTVLPHEYGKRSAVDIFFRTLAETHRSRSTAIVLSGVDGDGALGIKRIKEVGGITVAQKSEEGSTTGCLALRLRPEWWIGCYR
jgi:two-component system, chemotaxis family, CheB/CheR fusion protein